MSRGSPRTTAPARPAPLLSPLGSGGAIAGPAATFSPADSTAQGSGPSGPSVDLVVAFSLDRSLGGRVLRIETAASEDSGAFGCDLLEECTDNPRCGTLTGTGHAEASF